MQKAPTSPKSIALKGTRIWRERPNKIVMTAEFNVINILRDKHPTMWATLDRFLKSKGK